MPRHRDTDKQQYNREHDNDLTQSFQAACERRAAGGVGALAPARPQAVTLQPEVWKAEVTTEALPSPPPEPLPAE